MLEKEFVRSVQSNYERIHLAEKPDDNRYQYCILTRGGMKGVLPCSLRYIDGDAYLYYDITSKQNVAQMCRKEMIGRNWIKDFFWSYAQIKVELGRFLLDDKNILFYPDQIFQDIGTGNFYFLYLPYCQENNGLEQLLEFFLEHMDYEDEKLVECIYSMYEQYERSGELYFSEQVFKDVEQLEYKNIEIYPEESIQNAEVEEKYEEKSMPEDRIAKRSLWNFWGEKKRQAESQRKSYREQMLQEMEGLAVAEEITYDEEYGQTLYMEQTSENHGIHKLYTPDGRVAAILEGDGLVIGKQKEGVNLVLEDESVSRIHARIYLEGGITYLEDLNATNGTYKNGIRLQPYEQRRLEEGDEIRIGKLLFVYR